jgi:hypothetical protein
MCTFVTYSHVVWFSHSFIHENKLLLGSSKLYRILQFAFWAWVTLVFEWDLFIRSTNDHEAKHNIFWEGGNKFWQRVYRSEMPPPLYTGQIWIGWHAEHEKSAGCKSSNLASAAEYSAMFSTFLTTLAELPRRKKFFAFRAEAQPTRLLHWIIDFKTNLPNTPYMARVFPYF